MSERLEAVFRHSSGKVLATLIRTLGDFDLAEDALQDAWLEALESWPTRGVPDNPAGWLMVAARRRGIDKIRRDARHQKHQHKLTPEPVINEPFPSEGIADDQLRLIFTCCHPALSKEAQVALTLRTIGGLSTRQIGRAFMVGEPTMAQRLVRAKRKIKVAAIPYEIPSEHRLSERLASVLAVIYLIFNEGYAPTEGHEPIRASLCSEAIRLGRHIARLMPSEPEVLGLLALMVLHHARTDARTSADGLPVLLGQQDRALWDGGAIKEGVALVEQGLSLGKPGAYQVQAAIAALHVEAASMAETDWAQIAALYDVLVGFSPTPVVFLNRAVAHAEAHTPAVGLAQLEALDREGALDGFAPFHTARAELLVRKGEGRAALVAFDKALECAANEAERAHLRTRRGEVGADYLK